MQNHHIESNAEVPFVFCLAPVDSLALRAKMKAGMMQMRKRRYAPQQIIVKAEHTRAQVAQLSLHLLEKMHLCLLQLLADAPLRHWECLKCYRKVVDHLVVVELDTVSGRFPPAETVLKRLPVSLTGGMPVGRPAVWSYMERPLRERKKVGRLPLLDGWMSD